MVYSLHLVLMFLLRLWNFWSRPLPPCTKCMEWEGGDLSGFAILHREANSASLRCFWQATNTDSTPFIKTVTAKPVVFLSFGCRWVGFLFGPGFCLLFGLVGLVPGLLAWSCSGFPPTPWHLIWDRVEVKASQTADPYFNNSNLLPPGSVTNLFYNKVHCTLLEINKLLRYPYFRRKQSARSNDSSF